MGYAVDEASAGTHGFAEDCIYNGEGLGERH